MNENKKLITISAKEYNVVETDADAIRQEFAPQFIALREAGTDIKKTLDADITVESAEAAGVMRRKLVKMRTSIAKTHTKIKEDSKLRGQFIDSIKNNFLNQIQPVEKELMDFQDHYKNIEAKKVADRQAMRESLIKPLLDEFSPLPHKLGDMADDLWDNYYAGAKQAHADRIEAKAARDKVIADEAKMAALFADRISQIRPFYPIEENIDFSYIKNISDDEFKLKLHNAKNEYNHRISQAAIAQAEAEATAKAEQVARDAEAKRLADIKAAEDKVRREAQAEAKAIDWEIKPPVLKKIKTPISTKNDEKFDLTRLKAMLAHFIGSQPTLEESPAKVNRERKAMELIAELSRMINE